MLSPPLLHPRLPSLTHLGLNLAHCQWGPAPLHLKGRIGTAAHRLDLYTQPEHLGALTAELPGHLAARPVWEAWLTCHAPQPVLWTWGYQAVRGICLPNGGVFVPLQDLDPVTLCHDPDVHTMLARLQGMHAYLNAVRALSVQPLAAPQGAYDDHAA
ncbi:hypothetical protein EHF33_16180 [Deinococcus psychrotolerans]|uniref:Uncharacterized protein n=1 Tax=Deinococcus psychrotolerans TaxID=2489213 RepID=A0A3G8YRM5_9DEIO|nr:hypothetical protein [Deinococcus psychrotolerans]AZI44411.1 hypothetical protein EHF33_16180 [Deinococcus psychrotolerans]